jgi:hypothetical protein
MVRREELVGWLNAIEWGRPNSITPEAQALIDDHLTKIRIVLRDLMARKGVDPVIAHEIAQDAGNATPFGHSIMDDLFTKVVFKGAGVREALIWSIAAAYCWDLDPNLRGFANPWEPLIELYGLGYTTSTEDDPDWSGLNLRVGYEGGIKSYRIL